MSDRRRLTRRHALGLTAGLGLSPLIPSFAVAGGVMVIGRTVALTTTAVDTDVDVPKVSTSVALML